MVGWGLVGRIDAEARRLAAGQHGVVSRAALLALGVHRGQINRRLANGELVEVHQSVYVMAGVPATPEQATLAAVLAAGAGAVASHRSAAWLLGLLAQPPDEPEVTVATNRHPTLGNVRVRRTDRLERCDRAVAGVIPVTGSARTLLDLGSVVPFAMFEAAAEQALLRRLVTERALTRTLERLGGRGRPGSAALRRFLEVHDGAMPVESRLELDLARLLRAHGLPPPVRQHLVRAPGMGRVRIDFAYPDVMLGIEADGLVWHAGRASLQRDRARGNALLQLGWRLLRFTAQDVRTRPEVVANQVRTALAAVA